MDGGTNALRTKTTHRRTPQTKMLPPLAIKCVTELLSATLFIWLGNGSICSAILPSSKGEGVGFGFIALGYGLAIGFAGNIFGWGSAKFNPAAHLTSLVLGKIDIIEFILYSLCNILGAFVGQCLLFIMYYPHYNTVPVLMSTEEHGRHHLLHDGTASSIASLKVVSHKPTKPPKSEELTLDTEAAFTLHEAQTKNNMKIYLASVEADQSTKLQSCANKPAIDAPLYNFICEVMATFVLIFGIEMITVRMALNTTGIQTAMQEKALYDRGLTSLLHGLFIFTCILNLGGPTGFTANPCRDIGPRLAHYVLPIKGKGESKWRFSLIVVTANFIGAVIAAGAVYLLTKLSEEVTI